MVRSTTRPGLEWVEFTPAAPPSTEAMDQLVAEAEIQGHRFVRRLRDDLADGANRFDGPGEVLRAAMDGGQIAAIGGVNADPYADAADIARLRHVYVALGKRRLGVGAGLVRLLIADARPCFSILRLRTGNPVAAAFYEGLGFQRVSEDTATHALRLDGRQA